MISPATDRTNSILLFHWPLSLYPPLSRLEFDPSGSLPSSGFPFITGPLFSAVMTLQQPAETEKNTSRKKWKKQNKTKTTRKERWQHNDNFKRIQLFFPPSLMEHLNECPVCAKPRPSPSADLNNTRRFQPSESCPVNYCGQRHFDHLQI